MGDEELKRELSHCDLDLNLLDVCDDLLLFLILSSLKWACWYLFKLDSCENFIPKYVKIESFSGAKW